VKARLIRIGNSRGVRISKPLIEQAGLDDEVELCVHDGGIEISSPASPRAGWVAAAKRIRERGDDPLQDPTPPTQFDEDEWQVSSRQGRQPCLDGAGESGRDAHTTDPAQPPNHQECYAPHHPDPIGNLQRGIPKSVHRIAVVLGNVIPSAGPTPLRSLPEKLGAGKTRRRPTRFLPSTRMFACPSCAA